MIPELAPSSWARRRYVALRSTQCNVTRFSFLLWVDQITESCLANRSEGADMFDEGVALDFSKLNGLVPVVLQHSETREVLMVGFVNHEAWEETLRTGLVTLFRRTLQRVQVKGADFFFQAEDGIRDHCVTGVQTCALPI